MTHRESLRSIRTTAGPDPDGVPDPAILLERSARIERHDDVRPESKLVAWHVGKLRNVVRHLRELANRVPREPAALGVRADERPPAIPGQASPGNVRAGESLPAIDFTG